MSFADQEQNCYYRALFMPLKKIRKGNDYAILARSDIS